MMSKQKIIDIIGGPTHLGGFCPGTEYGPKALRDAGLNTYIAKMGFAVTDSGDYASLDKAEAIRFPDDLKNLKSVNETNTLLYDAVTRSLSEDKFPIILGGDHSITTGTAMAVRDFFGDIGLVWIDCHTDYNNTESSESGNIHGVHLSALTGDGPDDILPFSANKKKYINPKNTVIIGARDIEEKEKIRLVKSNVTVFTPTDIDTQGIATVVKKCIDIAATGVKGVYVSLDLDGLDPTIAPGVSLPVPGGLTYREVRMFCERLADTKKIVAIDVVELNPSKDIDNKTSKIAIELVGTLLGKKLM